MKDFMLHEAMKAQLWEEAKGKLRALVAVAGSVPPRPIGMHPDSALAGAYERIDELRSEVEKFIKEIEDNALQE